MVENDYCTTVRTIELEGWTIGLDGWTIGLDGWTPYLTDGHLT